MSLPGLRRAIALTLLLPLALPGCGILHVFDANHARRGALVEQEALKQLIPGTSTRADATSLLGSPTAHATFDDNRWIYYTAVTTTRIGSTPEVTKQNVLVLEFEPNGTLKKINQLGLADSKQIAMAAGSTPSPGSEASFMQQLLGNVGRFTPAGLPGGSGSGSLGSASGGAFGTANH